jgi:hypothetical protein
VKLPSWVVTVIVAEPADIPVTNPLVLTVAILALELDQVTFLLVAFEGATVAVSCVVALTATVADVGLTLTPVTATLEPAETKVAACRVTLPLPDDCTHFTEIVLPADAALYVRV